MRLPEKVPDNRCPCNLSSRLRELWDDTVRDLGIKLTRKGGDSASALPYLYWRIGRECGTLQRLLEANNISWGTYRDALGNHCNAHPNNLVILPPDRDSPESNFLAPLDFDMAYDRANFNLFESQGKRDEKLMKLWLTQERNAFRVALSGCSFVSTGLEQTASKIPNNIRTLRAALRYPQYTCNHKGTSH